MTKTDKQLKILQSIVQASLEGAGMMSANLQRVNEGLSITYNYESFFASIEDMNSRITEIEKEPETK